MGIDLNDVIRSPCSPSSPHYVFLQLKSEGDRAPLVSPWHRDGIRPEDKAVPECGKVSCVSTEQAWYLLKT